MYKKFLEKILFKKSLNLVIKKVTKNDTITTSIVLTELSKEKIGSNLPNANKIENKINKILKILFGI